MYTSREEAGKMVYKIAGPSKLSPTPDVDGIYDNPKSARSDLAYLEKQYPKADFVILKDEVKLSHAELDAEVESYDIQAERQESCRLPSTYRPGKGSHTDDVAIGVDGNPTKVWGPENPEDRYE
jgi:hypothetical protein